ncbi:two-component sensor histidine kinase [Bacteroidia bacterium]|nr:two-component sensor histidine kinase [Bacteroidia bacterium]
MKLVNYLILRIALVFSIVMLLWTVLYFVLQMKEIHDGNDEGLTNLKQEFIVKANTLPNFVEEMEKSAPLNLIVKEISQQQAENILENFTTEKIYFVTEDEKEEVRMLTSAFRCTLNGKYYKVRFFTSTVESDDLIKNMLYLMLGLWTALIFTIVFVSKIIISKANKPFYNLLRNLKQFRLDSNEMINFSDTKIAEYQQLNASVKELLEKNIEVYNGQKQFIENCSHELQTPVAIVVARLEMLLEKYQSDQNLSEEIDPLLQSLGRMKRLNSNLLLLSKIKNRQFTESENVDLREILLKVIEEFEDLSAHKNISIEIKNELQEGSTETYLYKINPDLARILFTNLMKNAIFHTENGGKVVVSFSHNQISIANSGKIELENVFGRYQHKNSIRNTSTNGLGLSIVKSIADLYGMKIAYEFTDKMHVIVVSGNVF